MRQRDEKKEQTVIENAMRLIVSDGVEGFSMNKLAKASGISVATLYIYYKDKDDLLKKIGTDMAKVFFESTLEGFSPDMDFKQGLWIQWDNRARFTRENFLMISCFERLKETPHGEYIMDNSFGSFKEIMIAFKENAVAKKQLIDVSDEIFWGIAYGPLYTLLHFQREGKNIGREPFELQDYQIETAFQLVIKALTP